MRDFGATMGLSAGSYALHKTGLYMMSINLVVAAALVGLMAAFAMKPPKVFSAIKDDAHGKII